MCYSAQVWADYDAYVRARLADAKRKFATKPTKTAEKDAEIAPRKMEQLKGQLATLKRKEDRPSDHRIFPGMYAPVMVWEESKRVIKPMRYQCRPAGKPASGSTPKSRLAD
ncbi:hypothetical protein [Luteimonas qiangzhengi]|uniref:hypothetical protein n=1 Tax=Luteimonas sp. MJ146 TaxID=3129240 RepID=UPI0031BAEA71